MARLLRLAAAVVGALSLASAADAHITRIEIVAKESPTFGGYSFPAVGQYEKIVGKAFGELDPNAPGNTVIVDLELAPRNARGRVEYSFDFYILKPIDLRRGAHKVMYEPPNRGNKTHGGLNRGAAGNDPGAVTDPADLASTFLLPRGYTLVWSGWDASVEPGTRLATTISLPVARNPDGSAITGPAYEYIVNARASYRLRYPGRHDRSALGDADASRASRRCAGSGSGDGVDVQRGRHRDIAVARWHVVHPQRHL